MTEKVNNTLFQIWDRMKKMNNFAIIIEDICPFFTTKTFFTTLIIRWLPKVYC